MTKNIYKTKNTMRCKLRYPLALLTLLAPLALFYYSPWIHAEKGKRGGIRKIEMRGSYWTISNIVQASKKFGYHESVTLTTNADYTFLDNLVPLVERWKGPISVAVYAPGDDFHKAMEAIAFLRLCSGSALVADLVTFHVFFDRLHIPQSSENFANYKLNESINCEARPSFEDSKNSTYKARHRLLYPINVARNLARDMAETLYVFASDIELYPTKDLVALFLRMVANRVRREGEVFVLPVFEVVETENVPEDKTILRQMIKKRRAFSFHSRLCNMCHKIPQLDKWLAANQSVDLNVFTSTKRIGAHKLWEPFYIGTGNEPTYDQRLTWEGQSSKMSQAYAMCLLDYDYNVLDNAFLVHKAGVKKKREQLLEHMAEVNKTKLVLMSIKRELMHLYGNRNTCYLI